MAKPLILVTNDDGIDKYGILKLSEWAASFGDVVVVAPDRPRSGNGQAVTVGSPVYCNKTDHHHAASEEYSCSGTPTDCVKLAKHKLLNRMPDLCLSGINHGSNASVNNLYSGTVSAALEAFTAGIPSIAFSHLEYKNIPKVQNCLEQIISNVLEYHSPQKPCILNVNFPRDKVKGFKVCRHAKGFWEEEAIERKMPGNVAKSYYWICGSFRNLEPEARDTDIHFLSENYTTVSPIAIDRTDYEGIADMQKTWA